jgi:hypothetical protein
MILAMCWLLSSRSRGVADTVAAVAQRRIN